MGIKAIYQGQNADTLCEVKHSFKDNGETLQYEVFVALGGLISL